MHLSSFCTQLSLGMGAQEKKTGAGFLNTPYFLWKSCPGRVLVTQPRLPAMPAGSSTIKCVHRARERRQSSYPELRPGFTSGRAAHENACSPRNVRKCVPAPNPDLSGTTWGHHLSSSPSKRERNVAEPSDAAASDLQG